MTNKISVGYTDAFYGSIASFVSVFLCHILLYHFSHIRSLQPVEFLLGSRAHVAQDSVLVSRRGFMMGVVPWTDTYDEI